MKNKSQQNQTQTRGRGPSDGPCDVCCDLPLVHLGLPGSGPVFECGRSYLHVFGLDILKPSIHPTERPNGTLRHGGHRSQTLSGDYF